MSDRAVVYVDIMRGTGSGCHGNAGYVTLPAGHREDKGSGIQVSDACHEPGEESHAQTRGISAVHTQL